MSSLTTALLRSVNSVQWKKRDTACNIFLPWGQFTIIPSDRINRVGLSECKPAEDTVLRKLPENKNSTKVVTRKRDLTFVR